jgi:hypothetical protein
MAEPPSDKISAERADSASSNHLGSKSAGIKARLENHHTKGEKNNVEGDKDKALLKNKPNSYKWLSKSSKRRVRSSAQKQKRIEDYGFKQTMTIQVVHTGYVHLKHPSLFDNGGLEKLARWRLEILKRADPFLGCRGVWHRFCCGHQFRVLCTLCAEAWEFCKSTKDSPQLAENIRKNLHWPIQCSRCEGTPQHNPSWELEDESVGEPYEIVRFVPFSLEYLDEEGFRSMSSHSFYRIPKWNRWRLPKPKKELCNTPANRLCQSQVLGAAMRHGWVVKVKGIEIT